MTHPGFLVLFAVVILVLALFRVGHSFHPEVLLATIILIVALVLLYLQSRRLHHRCVQLCHRIANELSQRQEHELVVERIFNTIIDHTQATVGILVYRDDDNLNKTNKTNQTRTMRVLCTHGIQDKVLKVGDPLPSGDSGYGFGKLEISSMGQLYRPDLKEAVRLDTGIELTSKQNMMCIPIVSNGQNHGLLQLISPPKKPFSQSDIVGLEGMGIYLDAAIQHASKIKTIRRQRDAAQSLYTIGLTISRFQQLDEIRQHVVDETNRLLNADFCWYIELNDKTGEKGVVRNIAGEMNSGVKIGSVLPLGGRIAMMLQIPLKDINERYVLIRSLVSHDGEGPSEFVATSENKHFFVAKMSNILQNFLVKSGIVVPVASEHHIHGLLCSFSHSTDYFDNFHVDLQQRIANQLLIAINTEDYHNKARQLALAEERQRMSDDLHDNMAQVINGLSLELHSFIRLVEKGKDKETLLQRLGSIHPLLDQAKANIREGIFELRIPEGTGIWKNLTDFASSFEKWHNFKTHVDLPDNDIILDIVQQSEILRVVQESLWNSHKHSGTHEAWLSATTDNDDIIHIAIMDKGKGLPKNKVNSGQGIRTMNGRVARLSGSLKIINNQPRGVLISIEVPYHAT